MNRPRILIVTVLALLAFASIAGAQPAAAQGGRGGPAVVSPAVSADGHITFRISAPNAQKVAFQDNDIGVMLSAGGPGPLAGAATPAAPVGFRFPSGGLTFTKNANGVWEASFGPVPPGAYRYTFQVDGLRVLDPVNTLLSESNANVWSMVVVPGWPAIDPGQGPHGAVAEVFYYSTVLKTTRRMHVYTPPGYEAGSQKYPVFYLLHGAQDTDDAWTSVGRAGFIFDNLIAGKKMKPMIVVMPAGHQPGQTGMGGAARAGAGAASAVSPFTAEFLTDMLPYVEKYYRTINDRQHRAIAGLSMGGMQTLDIAFRNLDKFAYIGVFSSGAVLGGGRRGPATPAPGAAPAAAAPATPAAVPQPDWESLHKADLDNSALKKGLKLLWLATGVDDSLITNTRATAEIFKKHGFQPVLKETPGAHSWFNWRNYLIEFAPQLF
jgi:enterochelin esterase-like enzyme